MTMSDARKATILTVDDEQAIRESITIFLQDSGYKVLQAGDGASGLDLLYREEPELVLLDLRMPGMDGLEVLSVIHERSSDVPVIIISGVGSIDDAIKSLRLGAWDYLTKPIVDLAVLEHTVVRCLERAALIEQNRRYSEHLEVLVEERTAALRDSERLFRTFVDAAPAEILVKDADGRYELINAVISQRYNITEEDAIGKTVEDIYPKAAARQSVDGDKKVLRSGKVVVSEEEIPLRNGLLTNLVVRFPVKDDTGKVIKIGVFATDITERKQTEKALRDAQKMEAIGRLTGGIAHDFNNILSIILGNLDLLGRQLAADEKTLERIKTIEKSAKRAAKLTEQLLGFSRRRATGVVVTDLNQVIGGMQSLIAVSATPEMEVEHHLAEDLGLTEIDPKDFEDALLNLVLNARDAVPNGGRLILATTNCTLDATDCAQKPGANPGEYVQLAVSDNGEGIPPEQQEHIFEPFFTTKPKGKGTGLGLAVVFGFSKRSGGYIEVHSDPGIGTTFRLYLPRTQGQRQPLKATGERAEVPPLGDETLLAVDDETELLKLARESLQALGYRVLTAGDGWQALEWLAEEPAIALLFSDVVIPGGMNGYELAERATADRPDLEVLLTSGCSEKTVANGSHARFAGNLLRKPYTQVELARRVRVLLGGLEPGGEHPS